MKQILVFLGFYIIILIINPLTSIYLLLMNNKYMMLKSIILILISSTMLFLKLNIGNSGDDVYHYINGFNHLDDLADALKVELLYISSADLGFIYFSYFFKLLTNSPILYLYACYMISLFLLLQAYKKIDTQNYLYLFILFLSTSTFYQIYGNTLREAISVSLSLYFIYFLMNGSYKKSFLFALIAFLFHPSAIILFIILIVHRIKLSSLILLLFIGIILSQINILIYFSYLPIFSEHILNKMLNYGSESKAIKIISLTNLIFMINFVFIIFLTYFRKIKFTKQENIIFHIYILYEFIYIVLSSSSVVAGRIIAYRVVLDGLVILLLTRHFKQKIILKYIILALYIMLNIFNITVSVNHIYFNEKNNFLFFNIFDYFQIVEEKIEILGKI